MVCCLFRLFQTNFVILCFVWSLMCLFCQLNGQLVICLKFLGQKTKNKKTSVFAGGFCVYFGFFNVSTQHLQQSTRSLQLCLSLHFWLVEPDRLQRCVNLDLLRSFLKMCLALAFQIPRNMWSFSKPLFPKAFHSPAFLPKLFSLLFIAIVYLVPGDRD